jgi:hypothetical protein
VRRSPWLLALALLACRSSTAAPPAITAAAPPASGTATSPGEAAPASPAGQPAGPKSESKDACALRLDEFDAVRGAAPARCSRRVDCACYSDIRMDNEMHVSDKATAARLQALSDAYRKLGCPTVCVQTVAQRCRAECRAGVCTRR